MNLVLFLCAALSAPLPSTVVVTLPCETLPQPVVCIIEVYGCNGVTLADWIALRACPPDVLRWIPSIAPPFIASVDVWAGMPLVHQSHDRQNNGCP